MGTSVNHSRLWLLALAAVAFLAGGALRSLAITASQGSGSDGQPGVAAPVSIASGGPGPRTVDAGVPVGYARSQAGATAAAVGYLGTGQLMVDASPAGVRGATQAMAADGAAEGQHRELSGRLAVLRRSLEGATGPLTYRQAVLATRLDAYADTRARVSVWHVGVLSAPGVAPPQARWATSSFELVWEDGDWKIWSETVTPGPAPILNDEVAPASAEDLEAALSGFAAHR